MFPVLSFPSNERFFPIARGYLAIGVSPLAWIPDLSGTRLFRWGRRGGTVCFPRVILI